MIVTVLRMLVRNASSTLLVSMLGGFDMYSEPPPGVRGKRKLSAQMIFEVRASTLRVIGVGEGSPPGSFAAWTSHTPGTKLVGTPVCL